MLNAFAAVVRRDLMLACRNLGDLVTSAMFFVLVVTLFSFVADSNPQVLRGIGAGIILVAALLSVMLSLDGLFRNDHEDGALEQLLVSPYPATLLVSAKILAHWIATGLPLVAISPLLGILVNLDAHGIWVLAATLAIGTPVLSLVGAFGAALVVAHKRSGVLLSLLMLPLCVPVLLFSITAVTASQSGAPVEGHLSLLGAYFLFALTLAPLATAGALRTTAGN